MTREEAVEVILEGEPWTKCIECEGRGHIPDEHETGTRQRCWRCTGDCSLRNPAYVIARELLGLDRAYPARPRTNREKIVESAANILKEEMNRPALARLKKMFDIKEVK